MIGWGAFLAYLLAWVLTSRRALVRVMQRRRCGKDGSAFLDICLEYHGAKCAKPIGELRQRALVDGFLALGLGAVWPATLPVLWLLGATPLTDGEAKRVAAEQAAQIRALERQLAEQLRQP